MDDVDIGSDRTQQARAPKFEEAPTANNVRTCTGSRKSVSYGEGTNDVNTHLQVSELAGEKEGVFHWTSTLERRHKGNADIWISAAGAQFWPLSTDR
ncbi:MAG: hypothetical protein QOH16_2155 [Gaiellaceae bacterium]|nr:hypothetical protein [Gaiellaceae bacterium]